MDMEPGRELDALVAERVMGLTVVRLVEPEWIDRIEAPDGVYAAEPDLAAEIGAQQGMGGYGYAALPHYSTNMGAAFMVMERLRTKYPVALMAADGGWYCKVYGPAPCKRFADTAPHAICLAALRVCHISTD